MDMEYHKLPDSRKQELKIFDNSLKLKDACA